MNKAKAFIKSSLYLTGFYYIFLKMRILFRYHLGRLDTTSGTTHAKLSLEDSIDYINGVFSDYCKVSGRDKFSGAIAELGPGDNAGVALLFLANGAARADLADKYYSTRDRKHQARIYKALIESNPKVSKYLHVAPVLEEESLPNLVRYYGSEADGKTFFKMHKGYEVIVSRSVLEHVDEVPLVIEEMYDALEKNGVLIHKVDLRDHGMFTPYCHSTRFLELPTFFYKLMTYGSGYPNRFLLHRYKETFDKIGVPYEIFIAGLHGVEELETFYKPQDLPKQVKEKAKSYIELHRKKYAREFQAVATEDLMVSSFFFVVKKSDTSR